MIAWRPVGLPLEELLFGIGIGMEQPLRARHMAATRCLARVITANWEQEFSINTKQRENRNQKTVITITKKET